MPCREERASCGRGLTAHPEADREPNRSKSRLAPAFCVNWDGSPCQYPLDDLLQILVAGLSGGVLLALLQLGNESRIRTGLALELGRDVLQRWSHLLFCIGVAVGAARFFRQLLGGVCRSRHGHARSEEHTSE